MRTHTLHQFGAAFVALLCALFALPQLSVAQEAYVAAPSIGTLVFYYDNNRTHHEEATWGINETLDDLPGWCSKKTTDKVRFDASFRNYTPKSTSKWFYNMGFLKTIEGLDNLCFYETKDVSYMFYGCRSLKEVEILYDFDSLQTMQGMFEGCDNLISVNLDNAKCKQLKDVSKMFLGCSALKKVDLTFLDSAQVTNMSQMFEDCKVLEQIDVKHGSTAQVTDMSQMFKGCIALKQLDVSSFDMRSVTNVSQMFADCASLTTIYTRNKPWPNIANSKQLFARCFKLKGAVPFSPSKSDVSMANSETGYFTVLLEAYVVQTDPATLSFYYDTQRGTRGAHATTWGVEDKQEIYGDYYPAWGTTEFIPNNEIAKLVFDASFKQYRPTSTKMWFNNLQALTTLEGMENLNTAEVVDFSNMFYQCTSLEHIDLSHFDTSKAEDMTYLFAFCESLLNVDVSKFKTSKVESMHGMFINCKSLQEVDLSPLELPQLNDVERIFLGCNNLIWVDISSFPNPIEGKWEVDEAFEDCTNLTTIYTHKDAKWPYNSSYHNNVFKGCINLKGAVAFDPTKIGFEMANTETGYFTVKPTAIESLKADALAPRAQQGIYTLQGVRLHTDFNHLPAGVYIVNGRKMVKH